MFVMVRTSCLYFTHRCRHACGSSVVLLEYSKEAGTGASLHAWQELQPRLQSVPSHTWWCNRMKLQELAGTNSIHSSILRSRHVRVRRFYELRPPSFFLGLKLQDLPILNVPGGKLILSDTDWLAFQKLAGTSSLCEVLSKAIAGLNATATLTKGIAE